MGQGGDEIAFAGLARQAEMVRAGEVSPTELVGQSLERIDRLDPELNAFRKVFADKAMLGRPSRPRRGGARGTSGRCSGCRSRSRTKSTSPGEINTHGTDAFEVPAKARLRGWCGRLREAGAIIVGLTLLPELGDLRLHRVRDAYGVTRNPWNPQRTPGGSSGGSGSAVAAGMVPIASARRRRLDPHPRRLQRPLRPEAEPRPRLAGAEARRLAWAGGRRLPQPLRPRHGALARHRLRRLDRGRSARPARQALRRVGQ